MGENHLGDIKQEMTMEIEEMMKALAQGGITVQGDLVMKKEVEYEVNNVEAGGIGIQVVNGKEGEASPERGKAPKSQEDTEAKAKPTKGPRKQYLFIEGDASWEEQGKPRYPYRENAVVRRRERDRFLQYLKEHCLSLRELTCTQGDALNDVVACFLMEWQRRGLIAKDFTGNAVWRFLHEDCEIKTMVTDQAYSKEIRKWVENRLYKIETQKTVRGYF